MSAIDCVDHVYDVEAGEKCITEMKPYSFDWRLDFFGLRGRKVSVILPADTQYNPAMMPRIDKDGCIKPMPNFIDGSSGIHVLPLGKLNILFTSKTQKIESREIVASRSRQTALVSFSLLPKNVSKEAFLNQLKKKDVQVLSESDSSLLTKAKATRMFSKAYGETLEKTMVSGDVVLQIKVKSFGPSPNAALYELLNKIYLVPQVWTREIRHGYLVPQVRIKRL